MSDSTVMLADLHGLAGNIGELRVLLSQLASDTRAEEGCESFRVLDAEEPAGIVVLSSWRDEEAMRAHFKTPHYLRYRAQVGALLAKPSDVVVFHVRETVHALDPNPPDPGLSD
jgi:quinol monooxygenase YgiN